jgi:hypothetical protein
MNYYECSDKFINKILFVYIDHEQYYADDLFIKNNLNVKIKNEMKHPELDYRIIFVKVPKKQKDLFIKCMEELNNKILLSGCNDYNNICNSIITKIKNNKKRKVK